MRELILDYQVFASSLENCVEDVAREIEVGASSRWMACLNPHSFVVARTDVEFGRALRASDWLLPDGIGIVVAARLLQSKSLTRITGPDFFVALNDHLQKKGGATAFLLGSTDQVLELMKSAMQRDWPQITVVGVYSPPFKDKFSEDECVEMIARINEVSPDCLWVGMTAPKQELWISNNIQRMNVKFVGAIGAAFDFYAGTVTRPHPFFRKTGLEWLRRLLRQPRRLWRRTFISGPIFMACLSRALFKREARP